MKQSQMVHDLGGLAARCIAFMESVAQGLAGQESRVAPDDIEKVVADSRGALSDILGTQV